MPKSAHPSARAKRTGKGGRTQAKGMGLVPAGFRHGRLKVSVMALSLSGAGVTTMFRKGYSPGRLRQGGARFGLASDTLPASARASPPIFTVIVARCCRSASGQRGVHRHNASGWAAVTGASGRFEVNVSCRNQILPMDSDLSGNRFHKMRHENCDDLEVGGDSHCATRQARNPSRRKAVLVPACWGKLIWRSQS